MLSLSGAPTTLSWRYLQHWLRGRGPAIQVADFVPETPRLRLWAATFPWAALGVAAVERGVAQRLPNRTSRGRPPVSTRVLWAVEFLTQELPSSEDQMVS